MPQGAPLRPRPPEKEGGEASEMGGPQLPPGLAVGAVLGPQQCLRAELSRQRWKLCVCVWRARRCRMDALGETAAAYREGWEQREDRSRGTRTRGVGEGLRPGTGGETRPCLAGRQAQGRLGGSGAIFLRHPVQRPVSAPRTLLQGTSSPSPAPESPCL